MSTQHPVERKPPPYAPYRSWKNLIDKLRGKQPLPSPFDPFSGNIARVSSTTPRRMSLTSGVSVHTFMPSAAGTEHDAGNPRTPSMLTRHVRQAPIAFMSGSLQSCEMYVPDELMASRTEAPSGTSTAASLILSVMVIERVSDFASVDSDFSP